MSPMSEIRNICVFCGSREGNDHEIITAAEALGSRLAERGIGLVYGGARIGLMGLMAARTLDQGGRVIGVMPRFLQQKEVVHHGLTELITTENMHDRKLVMQERSDAFIALPGGMGTLEELFEIITWLQLGLHSKPVGILNVHGYYDKLLEFMELTVKKGYQPFEQFDLLQVDTHIDGLLDKLEAFRPPRLPHWLNASRS